MSSRAGSRPCRRAFASPSRPTVGSRTTGACPTSKRRLARCRPKWTASGTGWGLGGHVEACEDCGHWRVAYQFRHRSWHTAEVANLLEGLGASLVHGDGEAEPGLLGRGAFIYLRLRRETYSGQRLAAWARRIRGYLDGGRDVFAYFKHESLGPVFAQRLGQSLQTSFRASALAAYNPGNSAKGGHEYGPVHVARRDQLRHGGDPHPDVPRHRSP